MKIRTQLVLAWLVLSILPLSVIVLYSYHSSRKALEAAYWKEAQQLTGVGMMVPLMFASFVLMAVLGNDDLRGRFEQTWAGSA